MALAVKSGNAALEYSTDGGTTWLNVNGVTSFDPGVATAEELDATDYDSPNNQREYVNGFKGVSDGSFVVNFDPADASHIALMNAEGGAAIQLRHQYGDQWLVMPTLVRSVSKPAEIGSILKATVTIKQASAPSWAAVS